MIHCPPCECSRASSHWVRAASWPTRHLRTLCMVVRTLRRVSRTARVSGSSRSYVVSRGSKWCISPSGAVLTGVDVPTAPPPARGGGMMNTSGWVSWKPAAGGRTSFWFPSILCLSSGRSCRRRLRVILVIMVDLSGFSGHKVRVAGACVVAASACLVLLLVPTPGVRSATKTRASSSCSCNVIAHAQCLHKSNAKRDDRANARVANVNKRTCSNRAIMDGVVDVGCWFGQWRWWNWYAVLANDAQEGHTENCWICWRYCARNG